MQTIPDIISKQLKELVGLKPILEGETKEFKLVRAGVYDPLTQKPACPQGHIFPGMDMIKDTFDNKNTAEKLIENIVGYQPIRKPGQGTLYEAITENVRFGNTGSLLLNSDHNNLYYFLKLHNKNRDNLNRKRKAGVVFYEVNEKKELEIKNNLYDYKIYAGNILMDISDDQLLKLVAKLNEFAKDTKKITFQIKEAVRLLPEVKAFAEGNPIDVIMASDDRRSQLRVIVDVAADNRWILFDEDESQWIWSLARGQKKSQVICKVEPGNHPHKALVDFMLTNKEQGGSITATELIGKYKDNFSTPGVR